MAEVSCAFWHISACESKVNSQTSVSQMVPASVVKSAKVLITVPQCSTQTPPKAQRLLNSQATASRPGHKPSNRAPVKIYKVAKRV